MFLGEQVRSRYRFDPDEVVLVWHEPKLAVVIDLDEDASGEPVLPEHR